MVFQAELKDQCCTMTCFRLSPKERIALYFYLIVISIALNLDHGTIPAASIEIKRDLQIKEAALGTFGSLVYFGNLIGIILLAMAINTYDRKAMLSLSILSNSLLLYLFTITKNITILYLLRILIGVTQSYITIFLPFWINQFAPRNWKSDMIAIFNISSLLGCALGYLMTMLIKHKLNAS